MLMFILRLIGACYLQARLADFFLVNFLQTLQKISKILTVNRSCRVGNLRSN